MLHFFISICKLHLIEEKKLIQNLPGNMLVKMLFNGNYLRDFTIIIFTKMVMGGICLHLITVRFQVVIPRTYTKYTSRRVLTTEWIDGEKLSQSKESNVGELVNVGVICYLKQVIFCFNAFSWYFTALQSVSLQLHLFLMSSFHFILYIFVLFSIFFSRFH